MYAISRRPKRSTTRVNHNGGCSGSGFCRSRAFSYESVHSVQRPKQSGANPRQLLRPPPHSERAGECDRLWGWRIFRLRQKKLRRRKRLRAKPATRPGGNAPAKTPPMRIERAQLRDVTPPFRRQHEEQAPRRCRLTLPLAENRQKHAVRPSQVLRPCPGGGFFCCFYGRRPRWKPRPQTAAPEQPADPASDARGAQYEYRP